MAILGNEDHKQRINLSSLAWSVMEMDKSVFDPEGSLSGFLNRICAENFDEISLFSVEILQRLGG